ncbi:Taurine dioxygenase, alpha-ketoglutarate-dependent [Streptomyces zhaozhouensis]|uniref:Taurine dioxygenase, alpha-ketoglutarate-dependent n=1 Tax=Streptomyces zhaozhouensis TaxID=1300267 RepID=A0A286E0I2_9ACTN|nr:TauD/TfdA family dioxygenase [Streptomyces zhaozhouensis]SOD64428.1 Taurine dioxygenase, alpha-ketoglutarate-dependent [Streptomyces zhaozhouensis]
MATHESDAALWAPLEITADDGGGAEALRSTLEEIGDGLGELLAREKAIVFRDFRVTADQLDPVLDRLLPNRLAYVHGDSPRTKVSGVGENVYTSTEYPPEYTIFMHNEMSYAHAWPARLAFFCEVEPGGGGATPVLDGALWLRSLDPEIREAFSCGVCYVQNLHDGLGFGKSWQDTFETDSREKVEEYLDGSGAEWEWKADGGIRVRSIRPATARHPVTGTEVWFNQADQWHPVGLGDETAAELATLLPEDELPQNTTFPDGSPIPAEYVRQIQEAGLTGAVDVDWRRGDLMLIDNVLVAHGRRPFTGSRRVLVAMSD